MKVVLFEVKEGLTDEQWELLLARVRGYAGVSHVERVKIAGEPTLKVTERMGFACIEDEADKCVVVDVIFNLGLDDSVASAWNGSEDPLTEAEKREAGRLLGEFLKKPKDPKFDRLRTLLSERFSE